MAFISQLGFKMHIDLTDVQKNMISGGIAGCLGKTITAPLSRITILFQVNNTIKSNQGIGFRDFLLASKDVYLKDGIIAFWKGNLPQLLHRFPYSAINFSVYAILKDELHKSN
jgi:solute carrier family 25 phosphate transporter 23/24/25/41